MKPPPFNYCQPKNIDEVLSILNEFGDDAQILAGGQSILPMLNMRLIKPKIIIDINFIKDTSYIISKNKAIFIGPTYRQLDLEKRENSKIDLPLIFEAMPYIGHVQHRARGTIIGSICHGDPTSELPLCFLALEGKITLRSKFRKRQVNAIDFYMGPLITSRQSNELATEIEFPIRKKDTGYAFKETSEKFGDFAIASFAAITSKDKIRFAVGGVSYKPVVIEWKNNSNINLADKLNEFAWNIDISDNQHTSAIYKRDLIRKIGLWTINKSIERSIER